MFSALILRWYISVDTMYINLPFESPVEVLKTKNLWTASVDIVGIILQYSIVIIVDLFICFKV